MRGFHLGLPVRERAGESLPEVSPPGDRPGIEDAVNDEAAVQNAVPGHGEAPEAIRRNPKMPAMIVIPEHVRAPWP